MFTWTYSEQVTTLATPEQIWAMWQDASSWPCWDSELEWVRLEGEFVAGTVGLMKPASGPEVRFCLSDVVPLRSFSDVAQLPLTRLVFNHEYISPQESNGAAQIRHSVTMYGLLAPLFGRFIGRKIKTHLRQAMQELSQRALTGNKTLR
ncbi:TPA: hypothetical protein G5T75_004903 [Salmonella enterica]|uniref:Polyketide cyclase n=1 Tax=Salmonella enterica TaxID=28901 RepID=A0A754E917_SALER|nr:SRPBCC family protein [Salmonella enterica]ECU9164112.1 hypothetical protein [Salmonella enterica subsp. enterica serovar Newport str. CFSAN000599]EDU1196812.1 hypothetical protein [Salmonella enterica subsp. enterica serovar Heidelberg str. CFSAN000576]HAF8580919.1 hypothetical protein [Salmonella enterica]